MSVSQQGASVTHRKDFCTVRVQMLENSLGFSSQDEVTYSYFIGQIRTVRKNRPVFL